jgi:hypothetical protein
MLKRKGNTMRKLLGISITSIAAAIVAGFMLQSDPADASEVLLYKNPQCGCCENYAQYLRDNGFTVTVKPTHELASMSRDAGIPDKLQGCHLAHIENYVVSGHVPIKSVRKLLSERPDIKGITLPGMPLGSPGMGGEKTQPFEIYEVGDSSPDIYAVE